MIPGFVTIYKDKDNYKHLYFYPGINDDDQSIYNDIDTSSYKLKIDKNVNADNSVDYKFYDKNISKITCCLIDNNNNRHIEVLNFK